jgi:hypothetical protein
MPFAGCVLLYVHLLCGALLGSQVGGHSSAVRLQMVPGHTQYLYNIYPLTPASGNWRHWVADFCVQPTGAFRRAGRGAGHRSGTPGWRRSTNTCYMAAEALNPVTLLQEHSDKLDEVLGIVVAHQGAPLAARLAGRLLAALAEPSPEDYRAVLRRLAALQGCAAVESAVDVACDCTERGVHEHVMQQTRVSLTVNGAPKAQATRCSENCRRSSTPA